MFPKKKPFEYYLKTDGVSCSVLFKDPKKPKRKRKKTREEKEQKRKQKIPTLTPTSRLVGIDPGKDDLIYCTNGRTLTDISGKHVTKTFRYSQNQRRNETKSKK